ncbi:hypothetical protein CT676_39045 [Bradyrhizobium sp. MOS001]|uniref:hypothetical protein n=1 Tax=Bradyrhizobium TaxID=374 RepID=UPI00040C8DD7|nr:MULTISPECIES: hypothetical protein [Bradyrhizobium]MCS3897376.1 hypothetical protein [Bradyrhizobium japonicum USDA 38]MCS3949891.1 hypothetical protein [Bradyrhizobium japonicum]TFW55740.1 hypothetical protein CT676_39045 [Bradyrhizobium sp. MOS001]
MKRFLAIGSVLTGLGCPQPHAADLPLKARTAKTLYGWTGFYVGGHFGYGDASFGPGTYPLPEQGMILPSSATGLSGGYQLGNNRQLANRVVLGIEADSTFTGPRDVVAHERSPTPFNRLTRLSPPQELATTARTTRLYFGIR